MNLIRAFCAAFVCLLMTTIAFAYDLPPVNLGYTNFLDAAPPPPGHGWYFIQYFSTYDSKEFTNSSGGRLGGVPSPDFNPAVLLSQGVYLSPKKLPVLNAHLGLDAIIPVVMSFNLQTPNALGLKANSGGVGNPIVGPVLLWDPLMTHGRPIWFNYIELDNFIPVGKYNHHDQINPGPNFYSFLPFWSTTVMITPNWDFSSRLQYLRNTKNDTTGIRAGNAIFDNFSTSYQVIPNRLRLGAAGYYLKQLNNSQGNPAPNSKEQVLGIGPGALISLSPHTAIILYDYVESHAENRTRGNRFVFTFSQAFGP